MMTFRDFTPKYDITIDLLAAPHCKVLMAELLRHGQLCRSSYRKAPDAEDVEEVMNMIKRITGVKNTEILLEMKTTLECPSIAVKTLASWIQVIFLIC